MRRSVPAHGAVALPLRLFPFHHWPQPVHSPIMEYIKQREQARRQLGGGAVAARRQLRVQEGEVDRRLRITV